MASLSQGGVAIGGTAREPWSQGQPFTLRDVLISGFFHRRMIIFFALLPLIVGAIAVIETKTNYTASGLLMVLVNREFSGIQNVTDSGPAVLSIEGLKSVESEIQIIESAETIRTTITTVGLERIFLIRASSNGSGVCSPLATTLWTMRSSGSAAISRPASSRDRTSSA